jgi:hypothetical protein
MNKEQKSKFIERYEFDMSDEDLILLPLCQEEARKLEEYIDLRLEDFSLQGIHRRDRRFMEVICILNDALVLGIEHLEFRETVNAESE